MTGRTSISRRELLRLAGAGGGALGLAALLAACGGDNKGGTGGSSPAGSLKALRADATQLSLLGAQSQLPVGAGLYTFGLATADNRLVTGGAPQVWVARDDTARAAGPFPTRWFELKAYEQTRDTSPRSPLTGFYGAQVEFPEAGDWMVAAALASPVPLRPPRAVGVAPSKRMVSLYSSSPSPMRQPHARQKRNSAGISVPQLGQFSAPAARSSL